MNKETTSVYSKLQKARKILRSHKLTKSGRNDFAHYNYFELGDFLPQALDAFDEVGLTGVVSFDIELATLSIIDLENGESVLITSPMSTAELKGCHPVQNLGAVQTYTRRYLWSAAMELIEGDAVDGSKPLDGGKDTKLPQKPRTAPVATQETAPAGDNWPGYMEEVKKHEGKTTTGKPYILYRVTIDKDHTATTFDEELYTTAKAFYDNNDKVTMSVTPNKRKPGTWELIGVQKVEEDTSEEEPWS